MLFDTFHVPHIYATSQPCLALYSSGRTTGISVHIGDSGISVVPVYEGYGLPHGVRTSDVGGRATTDFLTKICTERGFSFTTTSERDIVRDVKEKLCYVALDFEAEMRAAAQSSALEQTYELPDGQSIVIGNERFRCAEPLFVPSLCGSAARGLADLVYDSIRSIDIDVRADMWGNVVLSGGSSLFPGLAQRLSKEIHALAPSSMKVKVIAPPERKYSSWIGGSIVGGLSTFASSFGVTRREYDEHGPSIINKKCFEGGYVGTRETRKPPSSATVMPGSPPTAPSPPAPTAGAKTVAEQEANKAAAAAKAKEEEAMVVAKARMVADAKAAAKSNDVIRKQQVADTNCAVLQVGKLIADSTSANSRVSTLPPACCGGCGATLLAGALSTSCALCSSPHTRPITPADAEQPTVEHFVIEAATAPSEAVPTMPTAPMYVFCVDVSGSMGLACKGTAGGLVTRLQCMQQAVVEQIDVLKAQQPDCTVALVTFSNTCSVLVDGGTVLKVVNPAEMRDISSALAAGEALRTRLTSTISEDGAAVQSKARELRSGGATALGPALAVSVGLAGAALGSRVCLFTDGLANTGIGAVRLGEQQPFYLEIASQAAALGVSVSVLTLDGEECSMENLGTTADVTGGSVEVVDPTQLQSKVAALLQSKTLATAVEASLILPSGFHAKQLSAQGAAGDVSSRELRLAVGSATEQTEASVRFGCDDWLVEKLAMPKGTAKAKVEAVGGSIPLVAALASAEAAAAEPAAEWEMIEDGEVTPEAEAKAEAKAEVEAEVEAEAKAEAKAEAQPAAPADKPLATSTSVASAISEMPVQLQLRFTLPNGERRLSVLTRTLTLTTDRAVAEELLDAESASLAAIHHAAGLAQSGEYVEARCALIGTQRLLQRAMTTSAHQQTYLRFVVQAEKLDGFMRESQAAEQVFGHCSKSDRKAARDDAAAQAMYKMKSVTSHVFRARA